MIDEKRLITDIEKNLVCVDDEQVKKHVNEAKNVIIKIIKHQPKVNELSLIHIYKSLDLALKQECQAKFERLYGHNTFMMVFGRNYL